MKKLNFGCGREIMEGFVNVDIQKSEDVEKSFDFNLFPYPFEDNTFDYIWTRSVLEHLNEPLKVLDELWRISKKGAVIEIVVPHYNGRCAYDALDHQHYFSETAFEYLVEEVTTINKEKKFVLLELENWYSSFGKWIYPNWFRNKLSLLVNGIKDAIHVKLLVLK